MQYHVILTSFNQCIIHSLEILKKAVSVSLLHFSEIEQLHLNPNIDVIVLAPIA